MGELALCVCGGGSWVNLHYVCVEGGRRPVRSVCAVAVKATKLTNYKPRRKAKLNKSVYVCFWLLDPLSCTFIY